MQATSQPSAASIVANRSTALAHGHEAARAAFNQYDKRHGIRSTGELSPAAVRLSLDAASVITLRTARIARGGMPGISEAQLMITEKVESAAHIHAAILTGMMGTSPSVFARALIRHWSGKGKANKRRLELAVRNQR